MANSFATAKSRYQHDKTSDKSTIGNSTAIKKVSSELIQLTPTLFSSRIITTILKVALVMAMLLTTPNTLWAQTDFDIRAESADLTSEFQKELDKWMLRAYEGDRDAQFKVGVLFANDQFGPPDNEQASYWYAQAARQGHVLAQYNLGHQYLTGIGVKRDENTAMHWWLKAAAQQHPLAQFNVGRAYYLGIGLEKDLQQAKLWFERASQNNEPKSTEILKQLGWWHQDSVAAVPQPSSEKANIDSTVALPTDQAEQAGAAPAVTDNTSPVSSRSQPEEDDPNSKSSIAIFTNPAVRSVLITILNDTSGLDVTSQDQTWSVVSNNEGFPVWVSKNLIDKNGSQGVVTGSSVNARSVPLITTGSVVGRLNEGERVSIIDERDNWYRVHSPKRFKGWVKTDDLNTLLGKAGTKNASDKPQSTPSKNPAGASALSVLTDYADKLDNNEWLFNQDKAHYALQLASFSNPEATKRFINSLPFKDSPDLRLFTTSSSEGVQWTYILYGNFTDDDAAKNARLELKQKRAWVRRIGVLQQNRCIAWKKELPAPKELNEFCI